MGAKCAGSRRWLLQKLSYGLNQAAGGIRTGEGVVCTRKNLDRNACLPDQPLPAAPEAGLKLVEARIGIAVSEQYR